MQEKEILIPNSLINTEDQQIMSSLRKRQSGLFPLSNLTNLQTEMGFLALLQQSLPSSSHLLALFRASFTLEHVPTVWRNPWWYLSQRLEDTLPYSLGRTIIFSVYNRGENYVTQRPSIMLCFIMESTQMWAMRISPLQLKLSLKVKSVPSCHALVLLIQHPLLMGIKYYSLNR